MAPGGLKRGEECGGGQEERSPSRDRERERERERAKKRRVNEKEVKFNLRRPFSSELHLTQGQNGKAIQTADKDGRRFSTGPEGWDGTGRGVGYGDS